MHLVLEDRIIANWAQMNGADTVLPMIGARGAAAGEAKDRTRECVEGVEQRLADMRLSNGTQMDLVDDDAAVARNGEMKKGFPIARGVDGAGAAMPMGMVDVKFALAFFGWDMARQM